MSSRGQQFVDVYRQARVEEQRAYYASRAKVFQNAYQQLLLTSAVVFGISAAVAFVAGLDVPGKLVWAILAAIVPAVTTMLAAYGGLYAFERVAKLYRDAARNLRRVDAPDLSAVADERVAIAQYVAEVERIFTNERGQWGQLAVETPPEQGQS